MKPVTILLAAPGQEAGTSLSLPQMQLVALCDNNQKQVLLVTKVPRAQGAPGVGKGPHGVGVAQPQAVVSLSCC